MHDSAVGDSVHVKGTAHRVIAVVIVAIVGDIDSRHSERVAVHRNAGAAEGRSAAAVEDSAGNLVVETMHRVFTAGQVVPNENAILPDLELVESNVLRLLVHSAVVVLGEDVHRLAGVTFRSVCSVVDDRAVCRDRLRTGGEVGDDDIPCVVRKRHIGFCSRGTVGRAEFARQIVEQTEVGGGAAVRAE